MNVQHRSQLPSWWAARSCDEERFMLYRCMSCMFVCMYAYSDSVIQRILQLYGVIHETRIVPRPRQPYSTIHRDTALYEHTSIHRHTVYIVIHHPSGLATPSRSSRPSQACSSPPMRASRRSSAMPTRSCRPMQPLLRPSGVPRASSEAARKAASRPRIRTDARQVHRFGKRQGVRRSDARGEGQAHEDDEA